MGIRGSRRRTVGQLAVVAVVAAVALLCGGAQAHAAWPGANGYIVFSGGSDTNSVNAVDEIGWFGPTVRICIRSSEVRVAGQRSVRGVAGWVEVLILRQEGSPFLSVMTLDIQTGALTMIDEPPFFSADSDPAYSPDGSLISFLRTPDNEYYVANADGTGTPTLVGPAQPFPLIGGGSLSPDGTQQLSIAAAPDVPGGGNQLFVTDLATGTTTRLTSFQPDPLQPVWRSQPVIHAVWQSVPPVSSAPADRLASALARRTEWRSRVVCHGSDGDVHLFLAPSRSSRARSTAVPARRRPSARTAARTRSRSRRRPSTASATSVTTRCRDCWSTSRRRQ